MQYQFLLYLIIRSIVTKLSSFLYTKVLVLPNWAKDKGPSYGLKCCIATHF